MIVRKPIVGVMPLWDEQRKSLWMLPDYLNSLRKAGAIPMIFPLTDSAEDLTALCHLCSGFLFTGGQDVNAELYGEVAVPGMVDSCRSRDRMERIVLDWAIDQDASVLGICRGIQFINVALGGTLFQDLPSQHPSKVEHHMSKPYDRPVHHVCILKNTPLFDLIRKEEIEVNSYHHQAVKVLSGRLQAMAISEDGLTEAAYMPEKSYVWAVQWHPEFSYETDENSRKLFDSFVNACIRRNRRV